MQITPTSLPLNIGNYPIHAFNLGDNGSGNTCPQVINIGTNLLLTGWTVTGYQNTTYDPILVLAQFFDHSGNAMGPIFQANTNTAISLCSLSMTAFDSSTVLMTWNSVTVPGGSGVQRILGVTGQIINSSSQKIGSEFVISTNANQPVYAQAPDVLALTPTLAAVTWVSNMGDNSNNLIAGQLYGQMVDNTGHNIGNAILIDGNLGNDGTNIMSLPNLVNNNNGKFSVTWLNYFNVVLFSYTSHFLGQSVDPNVMFQQFDHSWNNITKAMVVASAQPPAYSAQISSDELAVVWPNAAYGSIVGGTQIINTDIAQLVGNTTSIDTATCGSNGALTQDAEILSAVIPYDSSRFIIAGTDFIMQHNKGIRIQLYNYVTDMVEHDYNITVSYLYPGEFCSSNGCQYAFTSSNSIEQVSLASLGANNFVAMWQLLDAGTPQMQLQFFQVMAGAGCINSTSSSSTAYSSSSSSTASGTGSNEGNGPGGSGAWHPSGASSSYGLDAAGLVLTLLGSIYMAAYGVDGFGE